MDLTGAQARSTKFEAGLSDSRIAQAIGSARSTAQERLRRAKAAGIGWPLPQEFAAAQLQAQLYRREVPFARGPLADCAKLAAELKRPV